MGIVICVSASVCGYLMDSERLLNVRFLRRFFSSCFFPTKNNRNLLAEMSGATSAVLFFFFLIRKHKKRSIVHFQRTAGSL